MKARQLQDVKRMTEAALEASDRESQIQASHAARMVDWCGPLLDDEAARIVKRAFEPIASGALLDPQLAVQLWSELYAFDRLRSILNRMVKKGEQVAGRTPLKL